jgi:hypothetical protein
MCGVYICSLYVWVVWVGPICPGAEGIVQATGLRAAQLLCSLCPPLLLGVAQGVLQDTVNYYSATVALQSLTNAKAGDKEAGAEVDENVRGDGGGGGAGTVPAQLMATRLLLPRISGLLRFMGAVWCGAGPGYM